MAETERRLRTLEQSPKVPNLSVAGRGISAGQYDTGSTQVLTTTEWQDGPGDPVTLTITPSGRAIVLLVVDIGCEDASYPYANGYVSFRMTGASTRESNFTDAAWAFAAGERRHTVAVLADGLEPGEYEVMPQARSIGIVPDTFSWSTWTLIGIPL